MVVAGHGRHLDDDVDERRRLGDLPVQPSRVGGGRHQAQIDDEVPHGAEAARWRQLR